MFRANSREEIENYLKQDTHLRYLYELATGLGKSYLSILKMKQWKEQFGGKFLIVIPKNVLIKNWKNEFKKFEADYLLEDVQFTTYLSLQKYVDNEWTAIICDEVHHLSERCRQFFPLMKFKCFIGLSATIKRDIKNWMFFNIRGLEIIRMDLKEAIDNEILPNPKVILIPMHLDNRIINEVIIKNPKQKNVIECYYKDLKYYRNKKDVQVRVLCTQQQWYDYQLNAIEWMKNKPELKNAYLVRCGERLKWLSNKKTDFVKQILSRIKNYRVITFCNSIEQSKRIGKYSINSKSGIAQDILDKFNNKEINKVTCIEMLTEGINAVDCKIGVFASLNSSSLLQVQKSGRIIRHKEPVIIIPYYKNTRDEEIVNRMIRNYDSTMIVEIDNLDELKNNLK